MTKRTVDIATRFRDDAHKRFGKRSFPTVGRIIALKKAASGAAVFFGARARARFGKKPLALICMDSEDGGESRDLPTVG